MAVTGMKRKHVFAVLAISAVLLCGLGAYVFTCNRIPVSRECSTLAQLPWFGAEFPDRTLGSIKYVAESRRRRIFAKVNTTAQEFDKLAGELNLSVLKYRKGFNDDDLKEVNKEFRPVGTKVSFGEGPISKSGRTAIRLYFEPSETSDTNGVLYIHIS